MRQSSRRDAPVKDWLGHPPATVRDWLWLLVAAALIWQGLLGALPAAGGLAVRLAAALSPFVGALGLAYLLDIPTRFFARRVFGGRRTPALLLAYAAALGLVALLVGLVVPQLVQSISDFAANYPTYLARLRGLLAQAEERFGLDTSPLTLWLEDSGGMVGRILTSTPQLAGMAAGAAGSAGGCVVALAASAYLLADKERLLLCARAALRALLPPQGAKSVLAVCTLSNKTFCGYIGGQLVDAVLVGAETFVLMALLRLEYAPLISVVVGVTNIIPVFGPFLGAVPGALILLLGGNFWQAVEFVAIIAVVQQIDGNFIAPRILGGATGLSGLGVLLAIVLGGELFGLPGMVIGVPVLAVLAALVRQALGLPQEKG